MDNGSLAERITTHYEEMFHNRETAHFDRIGFVNVGYWNGINNNSMEMAQINLIETLISFFHNTSGNVLDVACGKGASSKFLTKYFDPQKITGINISERQLETCRVIAPECNFRLMDAANLDFGNSTFDNALCIEAAFYFLTRQKFFQEIQRVLKPSGRLAMFDALFDHDFLESLGQTLCPRENHLPNLDAYRDSLSKAGFSYVRVDDCTDLTAHAACSYVTRMEEREFGRTQHPEALERIRKANLLYRSACLSSFMVYAIK